MLSDKFGLLFAALWCSEVWYAGMPWLSNPSKIHYKARGIVLFDRILCQDKRAGG